MEEIIYHKHYEIENTHWWFVSRNNIVFSIIKRFCNIPCGSNILDAGCGTGGFAVKLSKFFEVLCLDVSPLALEYCKKRGLKNLFNMTLAEFPKKQYDVKAVTMLDVVEHIEDDKAVVKNVYHVLSDGGYYIVSVPAYMWLWSHHDEIHQHKRRYTKKILTNLLTDAGFEIEFSTYFNFFLFFPAVFNRFIEKLLKRKIGEKDSTIEEFGTFTNYIFKKIFSFEKFLLPFIRFPFGVSILVIAKKIIKNNK